MLAEGFTTRAAAQRTHPLRRHQQEAHGPPWGAIAAITSGGAIPDLGDYRVILEPTRRSSAR